MKLHLPKCLYTAVVSATMVTTAYAANVADVEGTVSNFSSTYSETPSTFTPNYVGNDVDVLKAELEVQSGDSMRNIVFSSSESKEITWGETPVTLGSTLCVREGELIIKDSVINKTVVSGANHLNMQISGSNASLVLDNTTYSCSMKDTLKGDVMHVGGHSGAGSLTLQNNSHLDVTTWLIVGIANKAGYNESAGYKLYNTTEGKSSGTYVGDFRHTDGAGTVFMRNLDYGTGSILINEGCTLTVGGYIGMRDGSLTITGAGATLTTGNGTHFQTNTNIHGDTYSDMLGRGSSCETIVKIENGGKWNAMGHLSTGSRDSYEAKTQIYVDGNGSELNVGKSLALGYGESGAHGTVCSTELYVTNGGAINVGSNMVVGPMASKRGANPTYVFVDENSTVDITGKFILNAPTTVTPNENGIVILGRDKHIKVNASGFETVFVNQGSITCGSYTMNGGNLHNEGTIDVAGELLLIGGSITLGLSEKYATKAAITAGSVNVATADGSDYEVQLTVNGNLKAGKYMLLATGDGIETAAAYSRAATPQGQVKFILPEEINGMSIITDEDGSIILTLNEQLLLTRDPLFNAVQAANWGVFKSSQAFTSTLWGPRENAVALTPIDEKYGVVPSGRHIAWGTVYSSFDRQQSSSEFSGSDSSLYGAAIGTEYQFASGKSIGIAFGYDFGKVSPFSCSSVDQDSWHAAVYGRAANWNVGKRGSIALDWSVAAGSTTSDNNELGADWTQENVQLDARATYAYQLNDRTAISAFVGAQYYAQNDDSTERVEADSLQNLRLMMGAGINYRLTNKTTVYGEVSMYNDTMRHNPSVELDGFTYSSGANPGRTGATISAGAQYQLNTNWALRGNYGFETADDKKEHRVNVGASYSF